ncbi:MAG TPA: hotdog domain-containing protein [Allosphingosinicella sp.]|nr:hotdog domain-containing protein [Allosphingosinicella sp.]
MTGQIPKPPRGAQLRTIAMPRDANPAGDIFGGWTLSQMDLAGAAFAAELAGGRVATVAVEAMKFLHPIAVGDEVSCFCSAEEERTASVKVRIETWTRSRGGKCAEKVTEGIFTFVAVDADGKPRRLEEHED